MSTNMILLLLLAGVVLALLWKYTRTPPYPPNLPLPPGPKGLPIIGSALDIPATHAWRAYTQWAKQYGDVIHMNALGQSIIILSSNKAINDLIEKRAINYSDRVQQEMATIMGWRWSFGLMVYGPVWKRYRRSFHQNFNSTVVHGFQPVHIEWSRKLLQALYREPAQFMYHIRYAMGAIILATIYGIDIQDKNDKYIEIAEKAMEGASEGFVPGSFLVDYIPMLRYVPAWFPGAEFQRKVAVWKTWAHDLVHVPWQNLRRDAPFPSAAMRSIEKFSHLEGAAYAEEEEVARSACAAGYSAGIDTTTGTLQCFLLAMAMYPEAQKKAQEELAQVVGADRLPEYYDRPSLPYIEAVLTECSRWQPIVPLGLAQQSVSDDEYNGCLIPGGSVVMLNIWAMLRDPLRYPEPEEFKPERYIKNGRFDASAAEPISMIFGAGRRICPGRHFANDTLYISMASILHVFDISPPVDAQGKLEPKMTSGFLSLPNAYDCIIKPRSKYAESLITGYTSPKTL
ncbi:CyP450 monooxygenase [Obba rivulosa]|uniref:CyP450 monooxygenase n=1 Tax=Obba rivulosa TaxID=1052685 RepID=A0A8E2DNI5_9APHY|nr:CyP450 monooxygenase [Obba rivulosa]